MPLIPFSDVEGRAGTGVPGQTVNDEPKLNAGIIIGFTVTCKEVVVPHSPATGVKI